MYLYNNLSWSPGKNWTLWRWTLRNHHTTCSCLEQGKIPPRSGEDLRWVWINMALCLEDDDDFSMKKKMTPGRVKLKIMASFIISVSSDQLTLLPKIGWKKSLSHSWMTLVILYMLILYWKLHIICSAKWMNCLFRTGPVISWEGYQCQVNWYRWWISKRSWTQINMHFL